MTMISPDDGRPSISRTTRYKKVTKPLLERKRRARINRCLDELKDLMVGAFEVEGDNISKLEKADILELTVRHLTKLHGPRDPISDAKRFQAGFGQCAAEACQFILSMPDVDQQISQNLIKHLNTQLPEVPLNIQVPPRPTFSPPVSPIGRSTRSSPKEYSRKIASPDSSYSGNNPTVPQLTCDTAATISSTPSIYDLSKPMTGLLMTVVDHEKEQDLDNSRFNTANNFQQQTSNRKYPPEEVKKKNEAEIKNVIMKKIREQILGRKIRDIEPRKYNSTTFDSNSNETHYGYEAAMHQDFNNHEQMTSVDLRKKSKGESKHYSPRFEQANFYHHNNYVAEQRNEPICHQRALNYSVTSSTDDYEIREQKAIDYSNIDRNSRGGNVKKHQADYRNIHPKKLMIRPPIVDVESNGSSKYQSHSTRNDTLRHHRIAARQPTNSTGDRGLERTNLGIPQKIIPEHDMGYFGNKYCAYQSPVHVEDDHKYPADEQEENMWRPW